MVDAPDEVVHDTGNGNYDTLPVAQTILCAALAPPPPSLVSFFRVDVSGSSQLLSAQQLQIVRSPTRRIDCSVQGGMVTVQ